MSAHVVSRIRFASFVLAFALALCLAPAFAHAAAPNVVAGKMYTVQTSWSKADGSEGSSMNAHMSLDASLVMDEGKFALVLMAADSVNDEAIKGFTYGAKKQQAEISGTEAPRAFVLRLDSLTEPVPVDVQLAAPNGEVSVSALLNIDTASIAEADPYLEDGVAYSMQVSFKKTDDGAPSMAAGFFDATALVTAAGEGYDVMLLQLTEKAELDYLLIGEGDTKVEPFEKGAEGNVYRFNVDTLTGLLRMGFVYKEMGDKPRYANISFATSSVKAHNLDADWTRLAGTGALDTMVAIVEPLFPTSETVVIASAGGYWDALAANSLAGAKDAPVLLTDSLKLSEQTKKLIQKIKPKEAIICGGLFSVSEAVAKEIEKLGCTVDRVSGASAIDTAVEIAKRVVPTAKPTTCLVATAGTFQDALSAASFAYAKRTPIYLVDGETGELSAETLADMKSAGFEQAVVVGGEYWIPNQALAAIEKETGARTMRLAGADAYETSAEFAKWALGQGMKANNLGIATSGTYEDALTGAAYCGKAGSVLLLADNSNAANITGFVAQNNARILNGVVFGGEYWIGNNILELAREVTKVPTDEGTVAQGSAAAAAANARAARMAA